MFLPRTTTVQSIPHTPLRCNPLQIQYLSFILDRSDAGDLCTQAVSERSRAFNEAARTILEEAHPSGLMHSHAFRRSASSERVHSLADEPSAESVLQFPAPWPPVCRQPPPDSTATAVDAAIAQHSNECSSGALVLEQQRDLALWYSSLVTLSPSESAPSTTRSTTRAPPQPQRPPCLPSTSHKLVLPGTAADGPLDRAIAFEACMRKSTAGELQDDFQLLDLSQAAPVEAAAFHAVQVCVYAHNMHFSQQSASSIHCSSFHHIEAGLLSFWLLRTRVLLLYTPVSGVAARDRARRTRRALTGPRVTWPGLLVVVLRPPEHLVRFKVDGLAMKAGIPLSPARRSDKAMHTSHVRHTRACGKLTKVKVPLPPCQRRECRAINWG